MVRRLAVTSSLFVIAFLSTACSGQAVLTCNGSVTDLNTPPAPKVQYGGVTCITSQLDKEVTDGGE